MSRHYKVELTGTFALSYLVVVRETLSIEDIKFMTQSSMHTQEILGQMFLKQLGLGSTANVQIETNQVKEILYPIRQRIL